MVFGGISCKPPQTHTDHANNTSPVSSLDLLLPSAVGISIAQPLEKMIDERAPTAQRNADLV